MAALLPFGTERTYTRNAEFH